MAVLSKIRDIGETVANSDEDVRGRKVYDTLGEKVGTVDALMVDDDHSKVRFLRVKHGGFKHLGGTHLLIPVDAITSITHDAVTIDRDGDHLKGAPIYDPALMSTYNDGYWGGLYNYYGYAPYWGVGYTYPRYPYYI